VVSAVLGFRISVNLKPVRGVPATLLLPTSKGDTHLSEVQPDDEHHTILFICEPGVKPFGDIPFRNASLAECFTWYLTVKHGAEFPLS
jgi:hypothetical protein